MERLFLQGVAFSHPILFLELDTMRFLKLAVSLCLSRMAARCWLERRDRRTYSRRTRIGLAGSERGRFR